jgi:hypothetical protein
MSTRAEPQGFSAPRNDDDTAAARPGAAEVATDALPVLASETAVLGVRRVEVIEPRASQSLALPVVQAAAAAAGGFVAGAAVVGLAHRRARRAAVGKRGRGARALPRGGRAQARGGELVQIVGSRSFLLDVHLLGER